MKKINVASAHLGASNWVDLCKYLEYKYNYGFQFAYQYDDVTYRRISNRFDRVMHRMRTYLWFPVKYIVERNGICKSSDIQIISTSPFFLVILAGLFSVKNNRQVALMNDIYPDALVLRGIIKKDGFIEKLIYKLFEISLKKYSCVIFVAEQHAVEFQRKLSLTCKVVVIPISCNQIEFNTVCFDRNRKNIELLYCGTLGLMHEIKTFLQWIENFDGYDNISIKFHTSGSLKSKFENQALSILNAKNLKNNIYFGDSLQATEWLDVMMDADVGLVFQDSGAGSIVFPSKIVNMLASGQAVLAIAEKSSEIGKLILNNDCGWVVEPGDIDYLNNVLASLTDSKMLRQKRINAYKFCKSYFGIETVAARWDAVFNEVAG